MQPRTEVRDAANRRATLDYADRLETMLAIARDAATLILRVYGTDFEVDYKGPSDPVTAADRQANALICGRLAKAFPGVPIVAEESEAQSFAGWGQRDEVFFVDPLDGTAEFVARNGDFVVMLGLAQAGRAVAGVLVAPATGVAWAGAVGVGAWELDAGGAKRPIAASPASQLGQARIVVSRSHRSERLDRVLSSIAPAQIVPRGSAGLKGADVASGRAELYVQPGYAGKRWDACAPEAIVRAAGGECTDTAGACIDYHGPTLDNVHGIVMSNGRLHEAALARLRAVTG